MASAEHVCKNRNRAVHSMLLHSVGIHLQQRMALVVVFMSAATVACKFWTEPIGLGALCAKQMDVWRHSNSQTDHLRTQKL